MLYERYAKRRFQEGYQEGLIEGLRESVRKAMREGLNRGFSEGLLRGKSERDRDWDSWLERREKALAEGQPFDEPSPSAKASSNGH